MPGGRCLVAAQPFSVQELYPGPVECPALAAGYGESLAERPRGLLAGFRQGGCRALGIASSMAVRPCGVPGILTSRLGKPACRASELS